MDNKIGIIYCCRDCGTKITSYSALNGNGRCKTCSNKISHTQTLNYCCKQCGNWISPHSALYGNGLCQKCYLPILIKNIKNGKYNYNKMGKRNPNYKHGLDKFPYPLIFKKIRKKIRERDKFICQCCGITEIKYIKIFKEKLHIHHIDYNKFNNNKKNLITLCNSCHTKTNSNRDYWFAYYTYLMENR